MPHLVLQLVRPRISPETIELLASALKQACEGDVVGVALIMLHPGGDYTIDVCTTMKDQATFCRGMVQKLNDELGRLNDR